MRIDALDSTRPIPELLSGVFVFTDPAAETAVTSAIHNTLQNFLSFLIYVKNK